MFVSLQMADDSERDVVPVKDGSSYERQRNVATFSLSGDRGNECNTTIQSAK